MRKKFAVTSAISSIVLGYSQTGLAQAISTSLRCDAETTFQQTTDTTKTFKMWARETALSKSRVERRKKVSGNVIRTKVTEYNMAIYGFCLEGEGAPRRPPNKCEGPTAVNINFRDNCSRNVGAVQFGHNRIWLTFEKNQRSKIVALTKDAIDNDECVTVGIRFDTVQNKWIGEVKKESAAVCQ